MTPNRLHTVVRLLLAFLALSVLTVAAVVLLADHPSLVTPAAWVRAPLVAFSALVLWLIARRAAAGHAGSYRRLRIISIAVLVAIVVIVSLPGLLPGWLRIEQAVCGLLMLSVVILANHREVRTAVAASDRG
jgi:peptidoglycan/LPS O-acetylase OafA/YrhL